MQKPGKEERCGKINRLTWKRTFASVIISKEKKNSLETGFSPMRNLFLFFSFFLKLVSYNIFWSYFSYSLNSSLFKYQKVIQEVLSKLKIIKANTWQEEPWCRSPLLDSLFSPRRSAVIAMHWLGERKVQEIFLIRLVFRIFANPSLLVLAPIDFLLVSSLLKNRKMG